MGILPSKKFIYIVFILALLIGGGWFLFFKSSDLNGNEVKYRKENSELGQFLAKSAKDSDNDGLKDWEEIIWKTDPNNPDTDGDGTKDGEEILLNRDPTKPGPDDELKKGVYTEKYQEAGLGPDFNSKKSTLTEVAIKNILQEFFTRGESLTKSFINGNNDQALMEEIMSSTATDLMSIKPEDQYDISNIKTADILTKEELRQFGNRVGGIVESYTQGLIETEYVIFTRSINEQDGEEIKKLGIYIEAYGKIINDLLKMEVPADFVGLHLRLTNDFNNFKITVENMSMFHKDPVLGILGQKNYVRDASSLYETWRDINDYFINKDILFGKDEMGYSFRKPFEQQL